MEPGSEVRAAQRHVLDDHTRAVRRVRLPTQHTSFVGRDTELAEVIRLLETERAVAITGIPGVGKTRLAIESARRAADFFDDGVWFIARRDDTELGTTILETMRIAPSADAGATAMDQVCAYLSTMSVLLVLDSRSGSGGRRGRPGDNDIDILLRQCAAVTVLAVGAPSGVDGEHELTVHPLPVIRPTARCHLRIVCSSTEYEVPADSSTPDPTIGPTSTVSVARWAGYPSVWSSPPRAPRPSPSPRSPDFFASRMACHGVHTIAEYLTELGSFTMLDRAGDISCPTFIVESHGDPVGGQGKTLFDALTVERKQLYAPAKSTGVSGHCGGLGQRVWDDVVYDWLDGVLADRTAAASHPASAPTAIGERR